MTGVNKTDLKFPNGCKRIAVCFYGQYRTGDYLMPYFKEFYSSEIYPEVQFDFFCSTKATRSYPNSPNEQLNNTHLEENIHSAEELTHKLENCILNPVAVNVMSQEYDEETVGENGWSKLFHGMADSLRMKAIYEVENDFEYDLVFIARYDILIHPVNMITNIITWYNTCNANNFYTAFSGEKMDRFFVSYTLTYETSIVHRTVAGIQDLFTWCSSSASNLIMNECWRMLQQKAHKNSNVIQFHDASPDLMDGHGGLGEMVRRSNIGYSHGYPKISSVCGMKFPLDENEPDPQSFHPHLTVVREFFDLTLDPLHYETAIKHGDDWVNDAVRWDEVAEKNKRELEERLKNQ